MKTNCEHSTGDLQRRGPMPLGAFSVIAVVIPTGRDCWMLVGLLLLLALSMTFYLGERRRIVPTDRLQTPPRPSERRRSED
jgi:hypothetical protein